MDRSCRATNALSHILSTTDTDIDSTVADHKNTTIDTDNISYNIYLPRHLWCYVTAGK